MENKYCVLVDGKFCDDCGECQRCDLDPSKICDNCMKCVNTGADYNAVEIEEIIENGSVGSEAVQNSEPKAAMRWHSDQ